MPSAGMEEFRGREDFLGVVMYMHLKIKSSETEMGEKRARGLQTITDHL